MSGACGDSFRGFTDVQFRPALAPLRGLQDFQTGAGRNVCNFSGPRGSVKVATTDSDMKNIIELTEDNFETEVLTAIGPVLVDFYALSTIYGAVVGVLVATSFR